MYNYEANLTTETEIKSDEDLSKVTESGQRPAFRRGPVSTCKYNNNPQEKSK